MKPQKFSKKHNLIVGIFVLIIGISVGGYLVLESEIVSTKNGELNQERASLKEFMTIGENDTDKDGLEDWQEPIFGTDKNNPDTDGDGFLDGEEVLSGYDPLKPAPDDKLAEGLDESLTGQGNITQYLARQLAEQMNSSNPGSNTESLLKISAQDVLNGLSSKDLTELKAISLNFVPEPIKEGDLKITETTKSSVFDYLSAIEAILVKNKDISEDMGTFERALNNSNFSEIRRIAAAYGNDYQELKNLTVPSDFCSLHLELLNIFALTKASLESFSQLSEDPIRANLGLEMYNQVYSLLPSFSKNLIDKLIAIYQE